MPECLRPPVPPEPPKEAKELVDNYLGTEKVALKEIIKNQINELEGINKNKISAHDACEIARTIKELVEFVRAI